MKSSLKILALSLVSFSSVSSFAVSVGDSATMACVASQGGQSVAFTLGNEVKAIDEASDTMTVATSTSMMGQNQTQTSATSLSEYRTMELGVANIEEACVGNGELTTVDTLAGTFTTCKVQSSEEGKVITTYLANVPFYTVKIEAGNVACTLQSFIKK